MTTSYTFHIASDATPGDPDALDRAVLVRDGFAWGAFLAPALWFGWHRHLVGCLLALVAVGGLAAGLAVVGASPGAIVLAELLLHVLFGLEGPTLRRGLLAWRGRPVGDLVLAADEGDAHARAFARWLDEGRSDWGAASSRPAPDAGRTGPATGRAGPFGHGGGEPILGLFPEREPRR